MKHILSSEEYEDWSGDKLTIAVFMVGHLFRAVGADLFRVKAGIQLRVKEFHEIAALADSDNSHIGSFLPAGSAPAGLSITYSTSKVTDRADQIIEVQNIRRLVCGGILGFSLF